MDSVDINILNYAAYLARIRIDPEKDRSMLDEIDNFFQKLSIVNSVDTDSIDALHESFLLSPSAPDARRSDHPGQPAEREDLLANASKDIAGYFVVPR